MCSEFLISFCSDFVKFLLIFFLKFLLRFFSSDFFKTLDVLSFRHFDLHFCGIGGWVEPGKNLKKYILGHDWSWEQFRIKFTQESPENLSGNIWEGEVFVLTVNSAMLTMKTSPYGHKGQPLTTNFTNILLWINLICQSISTSSDF